MVRFAVSVVVLLLAWPALADDDTSKDKPATPAELYKALLKEYDGIKDAYSKAYQKAKTEKEREEVKEKYQHEPKRQLALKFLDLADKNPKAAVSLDALFWVLDNSPSRLLDSRASAAQWKPMRGKALQLLLRDQVQSDRLERVCQSMTHGNDAEEDGFLHAAAEKTPHANVRMEAYMGLARRLSSRAGTARDLKRDAEAARAYAQFFGKEEVDEFQKVDPDKCDAEAEQLVRRFADGYPASLKQERLASLCSSMQYATDMASEALLRTVLAKESRREVQGAACLALAKLLKGRAYALSDDGEEAAKVRRASEAQFDLAVAKYADVMLPSFSKVGDEAKKELFEVRHLLIGSTAQDIDGEDQDGKKFKLSDYKGKVVLLDFWANWCGPCRAMYAHERTLVKQLEGKPFALVGVNHDASKDALKLAVAKEKLPWRSWWDDSRKEDSIAGKWNVGALPTLFLIDHRGVIRRKWVSNPGDKVLDEAIEKLVKEAERGEKKAPK